MNDDHFEDDRGYDDQRDEPQQRQSAIAKVQEAGIQSMANSAMALAMAEQRIAQVQARWALARRFPRSIENFRLAMLKECERPSFAKVAIYKVPRGKKDITGLSIRFAEAAHRLFSNVAIDEQIIAEGDAYRLCQVEGTDMESNASWSMHVIVPKTVERKFLKDGQRALSSRVNSYGERVHLIPATDEETSMLHANMRSKAYRTVLLRLLPGEILDQCKAQIAKTQADTFAKDPDAARRELFDAFAKLGVTPTMLIEFHLGQPIESLTPAQLVELRAVYQSLRDGEATWPEWMATIAPTTDGAKKDPKGQALREKLKAASSKKPRPPADASQGAPDPKAAQGGASSQGGGKKGSPAPTADASPPSTGDGPKPTHDPSAGEVDPSEEANRKGGG